MTDRELMQQALNALEQVAEYFSDDSCESKTINALRERLAQPYPDNFIDALKYDVAKRDSEAAQQKLTPYMVHAHGAVQRIAPNKPLTDEELEAMAEKYVTNCYFDTLKYARAIEAAHGITGEQK